MNRFLCGVEGVKEAGKGVLEALGGVCDRVGSLIVVECEDGRRLWSGERFGGVACGIVESNNSERSRVENVRFASSAEKSQRSINDAMSVHSLFWK